MTLADATSHGARAGVYGQVVRTGNDEWAWRLVDIDGTVNGGSDASFTSYGACLADLSAAYPRLSYEFVDHEPSE